MRELHFVYIPTTTTHGSRETLLPESMWSYYVVTFSTIVMAPTFWRRLTYEKWLELREAYAEYAGVDPEKITYKGWFEDGFNPTYSLCTLLDDVRKARMQHKREKVKKARAKKLKKKG
ncbi:MAG: hypothetical protein QXZ63_06740 [Sulfolobales archaeon]